MELLTLDTLYITLFIILILALAIQRDYIKGNENVIQKYKKELELYKKENNALKNEDNSYFKKLEEHKEKVATYEDFIEEKKLNETRISNMLDEFNRKYNTEYTIKIVEKEIIEDNLIQYVRLYEN